jgi:hypothetical protein
MKVILAPHLRRSNGANLQQLRKTRVDLVASGERVQNGAGVAEFLLDIEPVSGSFGVFQIAVAIDNFVALDNVSSTGATLAFGGPAGAEGTAESPAWESSAKTRATAPMKRIRRAVSKREPPNMNTSL